MIDISAYVPCSNVNEHFYIVDRGLTGSKQFLRSVFKGPAENH